MAHILVVEDDPVIQMVLRKALTKLGGYHVTVTEDVALGLGLARAGEIGLVVMDVSLANSRYNGALIDGLTFTQLLKADPATRSIPVLLATAHALAGDAERLCAACGADSYIAKPFAEPMLLLDTIRSLLSGHAQVNA